MRHRAHIIDRMGKLGLWLMLLLLLEETVLFSSSFLLQNQLQTRTTTTTTTTACNDNEIFLEPSSSSSTVSSRRDWLRVSSSSSMTAITVMSALISTTTTPLSVAMAATSSSSSDEQVATTATATATATATSTSKSSDANNMFAPQFVQEYADFTRTSQGWSYRDVSSSSSNTGGSNSKAAQLGDRVVFDWSGYTIGYFGRPFQAKGGPQGGAFERQDLDYERTVVGSGRMIRGLEQALVGMTAGSVRQVLVPYGPLSYPPTKGGDADHVKTGPTPTTFSGQRALNFVLDNPRLDRTLLFNVKVIRVDSPNNKGGFNRG